MEDSLRPTNESILGCVLNIDADIAQISTEYKEGWKAISILVDSGASDSVSPPEIFNGIPILLFLTLLI